MASNHASHICSLNLHNRLFLVNYVFHLILSLNYTGICQLAMIMSNSFTYIRAYVILRKKFLIQRVLNHHFVKCQTPGFLEPGSRLDANEGLQLLIKLFCSEGLALGSLVDMPARMRCSDYLMNGRAKKRKQAPWCLFFYER